MPIQRGDIYFVNLNPVQGREQAEQRPVLVLSIDAINRLRWSSRWWSAPKAKTSPVTIQQMSASRPQKVACQ
jgi:hypothetical protein